MRRIVKGSAMAVVAVSCFAALSGCAGWTIKTSVKCTQPIDGSGTAECTAEASASRKLSTFAVEDTMGSQSLPDASLYSIDTTGSTIPYPSTGEVTVSLLSSTDTVEAANTFQWVKTGSEIVLADPAAVNAWAASAAPDAAEMNYTLLPFSTTLQAGENWIKSTAVYDGVAIGAASQEITYCPRTPPTEDQPMPCV